MSRRPRRDRGSTPSSPPRRSRSAPALRALVALERRPRGRARCAAPPRRSTSSRTALLAMARYEDPAHAAPLGWDADAVAARGRALRREEGRP